MVCPVPDTVTISRNPASMRFEPISHWAMRGRGLTVPSWRCHIRFGFRGAPLGAPIHHLRLSAPPSGHQETAVPTRTANPRANRLLASLPSQDFERLNGSLTSVSLPQGQVLSEPGDEVDQIYFPHSGMISLLVVLKDGHAIECATIGREGVVGATAGLGLHRSIARAVIQLPMMASKISATAFRNAVKDSKPLRDLITKHQETMLMQAQVTAGCNALHAVEARLARWILQSRDRADGDTVALTQEFLSEMLAVRRTSVSEVAQKLQDAKLIRYSRGVIEVLDPKRLEQKACECYRTEIGRASCRERV